MLQQKAAAIADHVAKSLRNPARTAADSSGWAESTGEQSPYPAWIPLSLGKGLGGVSMLFSATPADDPGNAMHAHAYLSELVKECRAMKHGAMGIYHGTGHLAFATLVAYEENGAYGNAVEALDAKVIGATAEALSKDSFTRWPVQSMNYYDVLGGLSGMGRYLLRRGPSCRTALEGILEYFVERSGEAEYKGVTVPGFWVAEPPTIDKGAAAIFEDGHLNLGLAHGICGPLALMSLALSQGVEVHGQRAAIATLVNILERTSLRDDDGIYWPQTLTLQEWAADGAEAGHRPRPAWCYGAAGVARAIQLAGLALHREDWCDLAHEAVVSMLTVPQSEWQVQDSGICHGWGGILILLQLLGEQWDDPRIGAAIDEIVQRIINEFNESHPFGFRFPVNIDLAPGMADFPGYLDGSAGVALALRSYADPEILRKGWASSLLVC